MKTLLYVNKIDDPTIRTIKTTIPEIQYSDEISSKNYVDRNIYYVDRNIYYYLKNDIKYEISFNYEMHIEELQTDEVNGYSYKYFRFKVLPDSESIPTGYYGEFGEISNNINISCETQEGDSLNLQWVDIQLYNIDDISVFNPLNYIEHIQTHHTYSSYNNNDLATVEGGHEYIIIMRQADSYDFGHTQTGVTFHIDNIDTNYVQPTTNEYNETIYIDSMIQNKKYYIQYKLNKYQMDYHIEYNSHRDNTHYSISSLYIKIPPEVEFTENTIYPIEIDYSATNNECPTNLTMIDNTTSVELGMISLKDGSLSPLSPNMIVEYKNKNNLQNYRVLKDLLFTTFITDYTNDTTANLRCNIYIDKLKVKSNVIIGDIDQVSLNLNYLVNENIDNIQYDIQYYNDHGNINTIHDINFYNGIPKLSVINSDILNIIQGESNQNCVLLDKDLSKNISDFNILNIQNTYRKYYDLLDYESLSMGGTINNSPNIMYSSFGYNFPVVIDHIFSLNGQFNKDNEHIYSLVQFEDTTNSIDSQLVSTTFFMDLIYDSTTSNYILNSYMEVPFNIENTTLNDAIYYTDNMQYIELMKVDKIYSLCLNIVEDSISYQGDLTNTNDYDYNFGLKFYPIKDNTSNTFQLSILSPDVLSEGPTSDTTSDPTDDVVRSIYNYKQFETHINSTYNFNLLDSVCSYNDIYLSDDNKFLLVDLNIDSYLYNKNNKELINFSYLKSYYINGNDSANYTSGGEIIKIGNKFTTLSDFDSDDILAENNQKLDGTVQVPIISYDYIDSERQFSDLNILIAEVPQDNNVYITLTIKDEDSILNNMHYPHIIHIYKLWSNSYFTLPKIINNMTLDFLNKYYRVTRFIMKNNSTNLSRVIEVD